MLTFADSVDPRARPVLALPQAAPETSKRPQRAAQVASKRAKRQVNQEHEQQGSSRGKKRSRDDAKHAALHEPRSTRSKTRKGMTEPHKQLCLTAPPPLVEHESTDESDNDSIFDPCDVESESDVEYEKYSSKKKGKRN